MYSATLALHSWIRWAVILLGVIAVIRAIGALRSGLWRPADDRASVLFTAAFDLQFLLGVILYAALSQITRGALQHMDVAMRTPAVRFWAVEHPAAMLIALILVHVGRVRIRRAPPGRKARIALIFFAIALLLTLAMTPWPNMPGDRPLFRLGG